MIYIVLPAYNEEESLPKLLGSIKDNMEARGLDYTAVVVDDGSTDATAQTARRASETMPVVLVEHPQNMGLAEALKTGFCEAVKRASPDDIIVTMDADNTHDPALIKDMASMINRVFDVVIASRYAKGARTVGLSPGRRSLSYTASVLFRALFPIKGVKDYTCGYRAYRARIINEMHELHGEGFISEQGFSCTADILLKLRKHKVVMAEVPMVLRYDQKEGTSKMKVADTVIKTIRLMGKRLYSEK